MPTVVANLPGYGRAEVTRNPKIYVDLIDGQVRLFTREELGNRKERSIESSFRAAARSRGMKARVLPRPEGIYVQFYRPEA